MMDWTKITSYPLDMPSDETRLLARSRHCKALMKQSKASQSEALLRALTHMARKAK